MTKINAMDLKAPEVAYAISLKWLSFNVRPMKLD